MNSRLIKIKNPNFLLVISIIAIIGGIIRAYNITYASLWIDELYTMFAVHPSVGFMEMLDGQRALQPPLYFVVLWVWVKLFTYSEFSARLLSVLIGVVSIITSGYLGRKIKNEWVGIGMALLVAFNRAQLFYSVEARFYVFVYLFAALSLLLYWDILQKKYNSIFPYGVKGVVDATLCYFHHFGILFVFAQFCFDLFLLFKEKNVKLFLYKLRAYFIAAFLYLPWIIWGLSQGLAVKKYWLKNIDVIDYFMTWFRYPNLFNLFLLGLLLYFFFLCIKPANLYYRLFPFICLVVIIVPFVYSLLKFPIMVSRYSMVMAPIIYLMIVIGFHDAYQYVKSVFKKFSLIFVLLFVLILSLPGLHMGFINRNWFDKTPWRNMASWIKQQPDYKQAPIYAHIVFFKNFKAIDFYFQDREMPSNDIWAIEPGNDPKMYMVEVDSYYKIDSSVLKKVFDLYDVKKQEFKPGTDFASRVYVCTKKN